MDYEKKYKDALERARKSHDKANGLIKKEWIETIFPELKENDDEKIRKAIVEFFEQQDDNTTYSFVPKKKILAWLKKQGEQKPTNAIEHKFKFRDWV